MGDVYYRAGQAAVWAQPDGPNTKPEYLGCHAVGDITEPQGDLTVVRGPDKAAYGTFKVIDSYQGAPGTPTTTITTKMKKTQDALEKVRGCPCTIFVNKSSCGRADNFTNYERSFVLAKCLITGKGLTGLAVMDQNDEAPTQMTFDLGIEQLKQIQAGGAVTTDGGNAC